jgi:hypothetical protein
MSPPSHALPMLPPLSISSLLPSQRHGPLMSLLSPDLPVQFLSLSLSPSLPSLHRRPLMSPPSHTLPEPPLSLSLPLQSSFLPL